MALTVHKNPSSILEVHEQSLSAINGDVRFNGDSGLLRIGAGCSGVSVNITIGDKCSVVIGSGCNLSCLEIFTSKNSSVSIGHGSGFTWNAQILAHEPYNIHIESGCIFASGSIITISDMHSIIDLQTKDLLNRGGNISIGDKVWVGQDSIILKSRNRRRSYYWRKVGC